MKNLILIAAILFIAFSCGTNKKTATITKDAAQVGDTITLSSDDSDYEILIIEPGFNAWLASRARPKGFHSQSFLENKNIFYVTQWNTRVMQPQRYNATLYEMQIDYRSNIDYGYDVNYQLYNYFVYFQNRYKQNLLGGRIPTN
ncbi:MULTISPECIES: DUF6146 family protein [Olleya]|uniref:DUF6146 family protein n=1 Tax=Olleya TaxID=336276 RepID=UPI000C330C2C|nr:MULTISPECIES: DUF6146 family protein [Olleya]PKG50972.1 hypothetical protein CXF54_10220 [Olleya sp. 1-3]